MPFTVTRSTIITATPRRVFEFMRENDEWRNPPVESVTKLDEGPMRVGSRYENVIRSLGRSFRVVNEITAMKSPNRLSWRQVEGDAPVVVLEGNYLIRNRKGSADVTIKNVYRPRGWGVAVAPLVRIVTERAVKRQIRQLERSAREALL